jgi:soluble lytic murein transglycosylase
MVRNSIHPANAAPALAALLLGAVAAAEPSPADSGVPAAAPATQPAPADSGTPAADLAGHTGGAVDSGMPAAESAAQTDAGDRASSASPGGALGDEDGASETESGTRVAATLFPSQPDEDPGPLITEADLASAFELEPGRTAKARFNAGRYLEAAQILEREKAPTLAERFLRALALYRARRFAEAAPAFAGLAPEYPALADRCHYGAGVSFEAVGDLSGAAAELGAVGESASFYLEARRALARVLARRADFAGAQAVLAPLAIRPAPASGLDPFGDALFELARLQEIRGERKAAAEAYLRVWAEHATSERAGQALERAQSLGRGPSLEQRVQRGYQLMEAHRSAQALELLRPIVEAPPAGLDFAALCRARFAYGKALRKRHQHAQAVAVLSKAIDECPRDDLWARAAYVAGTSAAIAQPELVPGFYRRLAEEMPNHPFADDALFFQAELLARAGRTRAARAALERAARLYPEGDYRGEALFALFWLERSEGHLPRALRALSRLSASARGAKDLAHRERALYWRARTLAELGRRRDALEGYEELARNFPAGYYALLARSRVAELDPSRAPAAPTSSAAKPIAVQGPEPLAGRPGALQGSSRLAAALELLRLGLPDLAQEELLAVDRVSLRTEAPPRALRLLALLLARTGDARLAHAIARTELAGDLAAPKSPDTLPVLRVAFPLAFREPISRRSQEVGIDPDLLQALIREESALDPKIHSWAGAIGLCQLMPFTAREVAGWLKLRGVTAESLHEPELNIRLGATYLARLIQQFKGNVALSLAAYNAGGGAVNGWLRQTSARDLDEFVEQIPVAETRNYVKKVLRSFAVYQSLYGAPEKGSPIGAHLLATSASNEREAVAGSSPRTPPPRERGGGRGGEESAAFADLRRGIEPELSP